MPYFDSDDMIGMIAVILIFSPLVIAVLGIVIVKSIKAIRGDSKAMTKEQHNEESKLIQEMYHGLKKMNDRVEALETILLDRYRKDEK